MSHRNKVLIVEDEAIIAQDLKSMLMNLDYMVTEIVSSGDKALIALQKEPVDVILMDIRIKGDKNGIETTHLINLRFDIPVIFLTAYADSDTMERIKETDAYGFIVKPASEQTIQGSIDLALYKHNLDRQLREREERLGHLNQVLKAIRNVNQLITKEKDMHHLAQGACDNLVESLGYSRAWIALFEAEDMHSRFFYAGFDNPVDNLEQMLRGDRDGYPPCIQQAFHHQGMVVINREERECEDCRLKKTYRNYGRFSMCLCYAGKLYGVISVAVPLFFVNDKEEQELFKELADDVAFAIYRLELEQKREFAENMLKNRERTLSTLMSNIPGMAYHRLNDSTWTMKFVSNGCKQLTGYFPIELINNKKVSYKEVVHPEDLQMVNNIVNAVDSEHRQYEVVYRIITVDGNLKWVWERGSFTEEKENDYDILEGVIHDITQRIYAEQALKENEAKYRALVENMADSVFMIDPEYAVISVNQAAVQFMGREMDNIIGMSISELLPEGLSQQYFESIHQVFNTGKTHLIERKMNMHDKEIWLATSLSPVKNDQGEVVSVIGVSRNTTSRKLAEQKLVESEERYRAIVEDQTEFIVRWLPDGTRTFVNDAYCMYYGKAYEDIVGTSVFSQVSKERMKQIKQRMKSLTPKSPVTTNETLTRLPNGQTGWHQWTDRAIFDRNGKIREIQSIGRDITQKKIIEEALKESESQLNRTVTELQTIIDALPGMVSVVDLEFNVLLANRTVYDVFGQSRPEEVLNKKCYKVRKKRKNICPYCAIKEAFKIGKPVVRISTPEEEKLMGMATKAYAIPLKDANGTVFGGVEVIMDISDLRLAEREIRESEALLRKISENYPHSYLGIINKDYIIEFASGQEFKTHGLDPNAYVSLPVEEIIGIETAKVKQYLKKTFRGEETVFEIKNGDQYLLFSTVPLYNNENKIDRILTVVENITDRKLGEEALLQSLEELNEVQHIAKLGSWQILWPEKEVNWSETTYNIFEMDPRHDTPSLDMIFQMIHPDDREHFRLQIEKHYKSSNEAVRCTYRIMLKDGSVKYVDHVGKQEKGKDGQICKLYGLVQDITERKQTELALNQKITEIERFNQMLVGREERMIELKREVNDLLVSIGQRRKYRIPEKIMDESVSKNAPVE